MVFDFYLSGIFWGGSFAVSASAEVQNVNTLLNLDPSGGQKSDGPGDELHLYSLRLEKAAITKTLSDSGCGLFYSPPPSPLNDSARHPATTPKSESSLLIDTLPAFPHPPPHPPVNQRLSPRRLTQPSKKAAALIRVLWQVPSLAAGIREQLGGMPTDKRGLLTALNVCSRLKSVFYQGLVKLSPRL